MRVHPINSLRFLLLVICLTTTFSFAGQSTISVAPMYSLCWGSSQATGLLDKSHSYGQFGFSTEYKHRFDFPSLLNLVLSTNVGYEPAEVSAPTGGYPIPYSMHHIFTPFISVGIAKTLTSRSIGVDANIGYGLTTFIFNGNIATNGQWGVSIGGGYPIFDKFILGGKLIWMYHKETLSGLYQVSSTGEIIGISELVGTNNTVLFNIQIGLLL